MLFGQQTVYQIQETDKHPTKISVKLVGQIQSFDIQETIIGQELFAQLKKIPWGHNIFIFIKSKNIVVAQFYNQQTI